MLLDQLPRGLFGVALSTVRFISPNSLRTTSMSLVCDAMRTKILAYLFGVYCWIFDMYGHCIPYATSADVTSSDAAMDSTGSRSSGIREPLHPL